jgi:hypothetical protein
MSTAPQVPHEVARFETSGGSAIVATIGDYKGRPVADFRKHYLKDGAELRPTPKGLAVELDKLPGLALLVNAALPAARAQGLLPANDDRGQA